MSIRITEEADGVKVLWLENQINVSNVNDLDNAISEAAEEGVIKLVVDLKDLNYIDSTGLGALVRAKRLIGRRGGDVRLSNMNGEIRELFEFTRLINVFSLFDSAEEAIQGEWSVGV